MTRGRIAAPASIQAAKRSKWSDETKARAREMYSDLEKRAKAAKAAIAKEGVIVLDTGGRKRNPWCVELDRANADMRALLKAGIFEESPTDVRCADPDDDDVADLLD